MTTLTPIKVIDAVALQFSMTPSAIMANDRKRAASDSRKAVCLVLRDHLRLSWSMISGVMTRQRDTVINSYQKGRDLCDVDRGFARDVDGVLTRLGINPTA